MRASRSSISSCRRNSRTRTASSPACVFEKVKAEYDDKGRRKLVPTGEPDEHFECDDVLVAVGQENAFPWIERDIGIEFDKWDMPKVDPKTMRVDQPEGVLRRRRGVRPEEHHLGGGARPRRRGLDRQVLLAARTSASARCPHVESRQPEDGHPRVELRQRHLATTSATGCRMRDKVDRAEGHQGRGRARLRRQARASTEAQRCLNCDVQTVFAAAALHRMRCLRRHLPDGLHHLHRRTARKPICARGCRRRRSNLTQDLYVADGLKTGRVMVKDEDVCLHCGLCAERCPTGAWDMQKYPDRNDARGNAMPASPISSVNDFVVQFANVNGSGSASANELFARADPAHGRAGRARATSSRRTSRACRPGTRCASPRHGHLGARGGVDLMVAMNPQTWDKDVAAIEPGGYLFYDSTKPLPPSKFRDDITVIGMPLTEICNANTPIRASASCSRTSSMSARCRRCSTSTSAVIEKLIGEQYKGKEKLIAPNVHALHLGRDYALTNLECPIGLQRASSADAVGDRIFIEGNSAAALGAVYGGATVCAWYPITPSSSLAEAFTSHCRSCRVDPETKKNKYAIVQAEDELASIGMVIGAGWNGARAFTATSGPGISLMQEFIGLAYFAEIPAVIFDVQRGGPSTGMPTRTQQSDLLALRLRLARRHQARAAVPGGPGRSASSSARRPSTSPTGCRRRSSCMLDLDIGMNDRLCRPLEWDDSRNYDRGKVMTAEDARGRQGLRPLSRRRRRRHSLPHLSRHASDQGRLLHPRHLARPLRALHRGRRGLRRQHAAAAAQVRDRQGAGAAPGAGATPASRPGTA